MSVCGRWRSLFKISKGNDMNIWNYLLDRNLKINQQINDAIGKQVRSEINDNKSGITSVIFL